MATVTVEVTREDIEQGEISARWCPIALALKRLVGEGLWVAVDEVTIDIGETVVLDTPGKAQAFIEDFDEAAPVDPITFDLDIPDELLAAPAEITS